MITGLIVVLNTNILLSNHQWGFYFVSLSSYFLNSRIYDIILYHDITADH